MDLRKVIWGQKPTHLCRRSVDLLSTFSSPLCCFFGSMKAQLVCAAALQRHKLTLAEAWSK